MLKNVIYIIGSIILFFAGVILYGIILNIRVESLGEAMRGKGITEISDPWILIDRKNYILSLYSDSLNIKDYKVVFGRNIKNKIRKDDYGTPIGKYKICSIDTSDRYYVLMRINYPNKRDAAEALKNNIITVKEFREIDSSINSGGCPYAGTNLGGNIGIHGIGDYNSIFKNLPFVFNWTNGSAAVSNESMDELLSVVKIGTVVEIRN